MKIATWNVNGIRARQDEVAAFVDARAARRPVPAGDQGGRRPHPEDRGRAPWILVLLARHEGVLGRRAARAQGARPRPPALRPPGVRPRDAHRRHAASGACWSRRSTSRTAARTSRPRCVSSRRWPRTRPGCARPATRVVLCGDLNVARARTRRPPEGARRAGRSASARTSGRCSNASSSDGGLHDVGARARARQRRALHLVGALAQPAPAQHRLAARLPARQRRSRGDGGRAASRMREFGTSDHAPGRWRRSRMAS